MPYYTSAQVDAEIAANGFNAGDYYTRTQCDNRYFPTNANPGNAEVFTLVRDSVSIPRQLRGILPRAPLAWSYLFSGTITELRCDAYSKAEADGRYLSSTGYTGTLDGRYLVTNANAGSSEVFTVLRDAGAVPRQLRGILPRAPLGWSHILSGTVTELTCDAWTKAEADGRFYIRSLADSTFAPFSTETGLQNLNLQVIDIDSRLSTLEASGGVPDPVVVGAVHGSGTALTLRAGSTNVRVEAQDATTLANFGLVENYLGGAPRLRVDEEIFIDDVSGAAAGLKTNAVSARPGDNLLTITGGVNGVSVIGAGLAVAGVARATAQVTTPVLATDAGQIYLSLVGGTTGTRVMDGSNNELLKIEADETQCLTRILSLTDSAPASVAGAVLKNTAASGVARVQLDANNSTGFAQLEVASAGGCTLNAPGQQISLQNQAGTAPVVVETDGDLTYNYGLNALSDARLKQNIREADLEELQAIFDAAAPKCYDRTDVPHKSRLGFVAQDFEGAGVTGTARREDQELMTLDFSRLTAVLWGVCKRLQARVDALEKPKKAKAKSRS